MVDFAFRAHQPCPGRPPRRVSRARRRFLVSGRPPLHLVRWSIKSLAAKTFTPPSELRRGHLSRRRRGGYASASASETAGSGQRSPSSKCRWRLGLHSSIPRGACCRSPPVFVSYPLPSFSGSRGSCWERAEGKRDGVHGPRPTGCGPGSRPGVRGARHPRRGGVARGQLGPGDDGVRIRWEGCRAGAERRHQFLFHRYGKRV